MRRPPPVKLIRGGFLFPEHPLSQAEEVQDLLVGEVQHF